MVDAITIVPPDRRRLLIGAGAVVLALVGAFSAGRFSSPAVVATAITVQIARVEVLKEKKIYLKAVARTVTRDESTDPHTGIVTKHEVETEHTDVSLNDNKDRTVSLVEASSATKTVTNLPRWRVGLGVGASFKEPLVPIAGPLVLHLEGEYRLVGGLSAGVWLNTVGAGGALVSCQF